MTNDELIKSGSEYLKKNNIKSHTIDSEIILSKISGISRESIFVNSDIRPCKSQIHSFNYFNKFVTDKELQRITKLLRRPVWQLPGAEDAGAL